MAEKQRVVVTGIGLVTPLGNDVSTNWTSLLQGRSGITRNDRFELGDYPYNFAGLVRGERGALDAVFSPKHQSKTDRFIHLAVLAGHQAMTDAGLDDKVRCNPERFGVYLGVGLGGLGSIVDGINTYQTKGLKYLSPFLIPKAISNQAASWLSMQWNLQGPVTAIVNACSSGGDAVGLAFRAIRDGYVDYMLAGGAESCVEPIAIAGFGNMRALSSWKGEPDKASRPFDKQRSGFVMAEGAGILVLEREDFARARGATIYAELAGYGASADAHHVTAMHPEGRGAELAIRGAMSDAGMSPDRVGYINAHGTSTIMNDAVESMVINRVFGQYADPVQHGHLLVSSSKSMTGHMLGAAGGAEAVITALVLKNQIVPPTINLDDPDPACTLDYVSHVARSAQVEFALSNSFGFGGSNAVLALKKY